MQPLMRSHGIQGGNWIGLQFPCDPVRCRGRRRLTRSARRLSSWRGPGCRWSHWNESLHDVRMSARALRRGTYIVHLLSSQVSMGSLQTVTWSLRAILLSQRWHSCSGSHPNVSASVAVATIAVSTCCNSRVGRMQ